MEVAWGERDGAAVLVVRGPLAAVPRVYPSALLVEGPASAPRQAMAGRWVTDGDGDARVFVPRFAFLAGTSYTVVADDDGPVAQLLRPPVEGRSSARVVAIEPGVATVPRNLLRCHVTFSQPMATGRAMRYVRLERPDGEVLDASLLPLDPELWDAPRRRLTVLLDPARIKRGLVPHEEAGYPLVEGEDVRLVVLAGFPDADGRPLPEGSVAAFHVGPDLRGRVDPARWDVRSPAAGTLDPLRVRFDRTLDRPLVDRCLRVGGGPTGVGRAGSDGRGWTFLPDEPWVAGTVVVDIDPVLEDVAGNAVARVFDRDLDDRGDDPLPAGADTRLVVAIPGRHHA